LLNSGAAAPLPSRGGAGVGSVTSSNFKDFKDFEDFKKKTPQPEK
jgi:hypothetical protein